MQVDLNQMMQVAIRHAVAEALSEREREERDAETVAALKAKLPGVPLYKTHVDDVLLVFRPPTAEKWAAVEAAHASGVSQRKVMLELVQGCILHPSWDAVEELAEQRPALLVKLSEQCIRLAGLDDGLNFKRAR